MIAYIEQNSDQQCASVNFFQAMVGFQDMGWEIRYFQHLDQINTHQRGELWVASILSQVLIHLKIYLYDSKITYFPLCNA